MSARPRGCTIPPAFVYATGGMGCTYLASVDRRAVRLGRPPLYCGQPRDNPTTSYCREHAALCEVRLPRRAASAAAIAILVP